MEDRRGAPLLYPVALDLRDRPALVVGGGAVAARKAAGLMACGAAVTVVAPDLDPSLEALAAPSPSAPVPGDGVAGAGDLGGTAGAGDLGGTAGAGDLGGTAGGAGGTAGAGGGTVTLERRRYRAGDAAGYRLVVSATGVPAVDAAVSRDAEAAGVWVNSADDVANCTFLLPSVHRDGPLTVAVSTGGASPALARWVRRRIADDLGPGLGSLAALLADARTGLKAQGRSTADIDWQALLDGPLPGLVRRGDLARARALLRTAIE